MGAGEKEKLIKNDKAGGTLFPLPKSAYLLDAVVDRPGATLAQGLVMEGKPEVSLA